MAIKYYAGSKLTGVSGDTKPTTLPTGSTFLETNTDDLYFWDGDSWNVIASNTVAQTLSNKTLTSPVFNTGLSGTAFLDEDNFSSDSATKIASQQSIKAYISSQVSGSQNVFSTVAVSGQDNVVADATTDTLTLVAGSNMTITTTAGSDSITFASSGSGTITITDNESTAENNLITFVANAATSTGAHGLEMDGDFHYNPNTGTVTATIFAGALTGNASGTSATVTGAAQTAITSVGTLTALQVDNLNINGNTISSTAGTDLLITPLSGQQLILDGTIIIDAGVVTGATSITSTAFVGELTGNASTATALATARTIGGTSFDGTGNIVPGTITVADTTDTTSFVALFEDATGDLAPKTDAGVTYNAGTGTLTSTAFVGALTGDVTGDASGTAATVTGATQAAITSAANLATVGTIGTGVWNGTALVQAYIGAETINESKLQVSNGPTNGYVLSAQSGNTGGMTWVAAGAGEANEYAFKTIAVSGQTNVVADTTTDTLTLVAGANMTITTSGDSITLVAASSSGASESFAIAMAVAL